MAAPSIRSVVTSLRNCKLDGRKGGSQMYHTPAADEEIDEVTVDLNSDSVFLNHWEQCLDMKTGKVFYANWKNGGRTTEDPRLASSIMGPSYSSSEGSNSDCDPAIEYEEEEDTDGDVEDCCSFAGYRTDYEGDTSNNSSTSFSRSSPSNSDVCSEGGGAGVLILVVAGCKSCFMYFMVPKGVGACPKCGGCLLQLGSN